MTTLAQLRDLRRRLAESDRLRSTVDNAADVAALDALLAAADALDGTESQLEEILRERERLGGIRGLTAAERESSWERYTRAMRRRSAARARVDAILRGES